MTPLAPRLAGMTLIELLVAMALFAVIGSLSYRALAGVRHTAERTSEISVRWQHIDRALARFVLDLRQPLALPSRDGARWRAVWLGNSSDMPVGIEFTRPGGEHREAQRIAYRWREGVFELLHWADVNIDGQPPMVYPLLSGVRQARFDFLDMTGNWLAAWEADDITATPWPRAVRLVLDLDEGIALERIVDLP